MILLLVGYILAFVLLAGIAGLVLLHRQAPSGWIDIKPQSSAAGGSSIALAPASPAISIAASPPAPAAVLAPPPVVAPVAPPQAASAPPIPTPPATPPETPPAVSPPATTLPPPAPAATAAPTSPFAPASPPDLPSAMAPVGANGYPPPPPEKPSKPAAATVAANPSAAPGATAAPPPPGPGTEVASAPPASGSLSENGPYGPLPHIAADGRLPWIANDARFDHRTRIPRIAVLMVGLGFDARTTEDAIVKLPPEISLGFLPYTQNLERWTKLARDFGHEVLLSLPLDSGDPTTQQVLGPRMLSSKLSGAENIDRLRWLLAQARNYIGLVTWSGEAFLADSAAVRPVLQEISGRGLMLVDSRMAKPNVIQDMADGIGLPFAKSRGFIDEPRDAESVDANLLRLEEIAQKNNFAMAMAVAFPVSIERLANWSRTVTQRGFVLAPVTGVTQCAEICQARVRRHAAAVQAIRKGQ